MVDRVATKPATIQKSNREKLWATSSHHKEFFFPYLGLFEIVMLGPIPMNHDCPHQDGNLDGIHEFQTNPFADRIFWVNQ